MKQPRTGEPASPLEEALERLRVRLGAECWVLCRLDGGQWSTHALPVCRALEIEHHVEQMEDMVGVDLGEVHPFDPGQELGEEVRWVWCPRAGRVGEGDEHWRWGGRGENRMVSVDPSPTEEEP